MRMEFVLAGKEERKKMNSRLPFNLILSNFAKTPFKYYLFVNAIHFSSCAFKIIFFKDRSFDNLEGGLRIIYTYIYRD